MTKHLQPAAESRNENLVLFTQFNIAPLLSAKPIGVNPRNISAGGERIEFINTYDLSPAEWKVAEILANEGYGNEKIAEELNISKRTVETHIAKILRKMDLVNRTEIAVKILKDTFLEPLDVVE